MRSIVRLALFGALLVPAPAPAAEWRGHGLLDLTLASGSEAQPLDRLSQGDSNFDPYRVHLFLDASLSPTLAVYSETILHEGLSSLRLDGAYAQWTPWPERDLHLQAGKVPWPIGTWAARTYSDRNPLVGMPLMYQYHTSLAWDLPTTSIDQLVASAGTGQTGLLYGAAPGLAMPVVDDRWWDVGVVALEAQRPFEFAVGALQGSPGWPVNATDVTPGQTTLGRLGLVPAAGIRAGVSGAWGTWQPEWFSYSLRPGESLREYHEGLLMTDLELERGAWELRGEGFLKTWQTIATGTLHLHGGYAEARAGMGNGWLAARYDALRFGNVTTSAGIERPWDDGVDRIELGTGYRVSRDVRVKLAAQRNRRHPWGGPAHDADLFAGSASIRF